MFRANENVLDGEIQIVNSMPSIGWKHNLKMMRKKLSVALISTSDPSKKFSINKDLNGGLGTADDFGTTTPWSSFIAQTRRKSVKMPVVSFAYLNAILKSAGHTVRYFEDVVPDAIGNSDFDVILMYGSIVDFKWENLVCGELKKRYPKARVGVFGPFPSRFPEYFSHADFVLGGESEAFFMDEFVDVEQLKGIVQVSKMTDFERIPTPDFDGFPIHKYRYFPALGKTPFVPMLASKGCPYSCRAYCTYGEYQGAKTRSRAPELVVSDLVRLQKRHSIRAVQFRDPTFGLPTNYFSNFIESIHSAGLKIDWGIETRSDLLSKDLINQMARAGLRNLNIGIETASTEVAGKSKRVLVKEPHQEEVVEACKRAGVNVAAFYILGQEADTPETMQGTIDYAVRLNTPLARFSVFTPYPGTKVYSKMNDAGLIVEKDFEKYTQFSLVYANKLLTPSDIRNWVAIAARCYYMRPTFLLLALIRHSKDRVTNAAYNTYRGLAAALARVVSASSERRSSKASA